MHAIKPPGLVSRLKESRAVFDMGRAGLSILSGRSAANDELRARSDAAPILLFPGFASDDRALWPLKTYLRRLGYCVEGWGLGANLAGTNLPHSIDDVHPRWDISLSNVGAPHEYNGEAGVPLLCDRAIEQVQQRSEALGQPVTLVGWSLGGFIAREVARELPDAVNRLVTFGAPVIGGPKYTAAASAFKARGQDLDWIELEIAKREKTPIQQPITAIYSKSDGVVAWEASIDHHSPDVRHIEVDVSHIGMGFNGEVWHLIAQSLVQ